MHLRNSTSRQSNIGNVLIIPFPNGKQTDFTIWNSHSVPLVIWLFQRLAFLNLMYTANCSRRLSLHPSQLSYEISTSTKRNKEDIMFPTSTQLSALIGIATLIGMCCELYILHLFARPNYPGNRVYA